MCDKSCSSTSIKDRPRRPCVAPPRDQKPASDSESDVSRVLTVQSGAASNKPNVAGPTIISAAALRKKSQIADSKGKRIFVSVPTKKQELAEFTESSESDSVFLRTQTKKSRVATTSKEKRISVSVPTKKPQVTEHGESSESNSKFVKTPTKKSRVAASKEKRVFVSVPTKKSQVGQSRESSESDGGSVRSPTKKSRIAASKEKRLFVSVPTKKPQIAASSEITESDPESVRTPTKKSRVLPFIDSCDSDETPALEQTKLGVAASKEKRMFVSVPTKKPQVAQSRESSESDSDSIRSPTKKSRIAASKEKRLFVSVPTKKPQIAAISEISESDPESVRTPTKKSRVLPLIDSCDSDETPALEQTKLGVAASKEKRMFVSVPTKKRQVAQSRESSASDSDSIRSSTKNSRIAASKEKRLFVSVPTKKPQIAAISEISESDPESVRTPTKKSRVLPFIDSCDSDETPALEQTKLGVAASKEKRMFVSVPTKKPQVAQSRESSASDGDSIRSSTKKSRIAASKEKRLFVSVPTKKPQIAAISEISESDPESVRTPTKKSRVLPLIDSCDSDETPALEQTKLGVAASKEKRMFVSVPTKKPQVSKSRASTESDSASVSTVTTKSRDLSCDSTAASDSDQTERSNPKKTPVSTQRRRRSSKKQRYISTNSSEESADSSITIPLRKSRLDRSKSRDLAAQEERPVLSPLVECEDDDSAMLRAMQTPTKRRLTFPESPDDEPGQPVAESTIYSANPSRRRKTIMPLMTDLPEIRRASRSTSSPAYLLPEDVSTVRSGRRSSRRLSSSTSNTLLDETSKFIDWEHDTGANDEDVESLVMEMENIIIKAKGKDYELFKPINNDGLYHHVVRDYLDIEIYITKWIKSYHDGYKLESICEILQLFTDIMGYQRMIKVKDVYNKLEDIDFDSKIHPVMEKINSIQNEVNITVPSYLVACNYQWSKGVRNAFHSFFDALLIKCYTANILYPVTVQLNFFFMHATQSTLLPVIHTNTLILLYLLNTFVDFIINLKDNDGNCELFQWLNNMVLYYLDQIYGSNKLMRKFTDKRLSSLRFGVLHYLKCFIKKLPSVFLSNDKTYYALKRFLLDEETLVRKEAVNCCITIVSTGIGKQHISKDSLKLLMTVVIGRIEDVDLNIASLAIQCHTKAIQRFSSFAQQLKIPTLVASLSMRSEHFILRKQALLNFCVKLKMNQFTEDKFLLKIVEFIHGLNTNEKETFIVYLVEAVYKQMKELSNLELILGVMELSELKEEKYASYLLEIFCYSVRMQYLGCIDDIGEESAKATPDGKVRRTITNLILQQIEPVLNKFDERGVKCILQTLNVLALHDLQTTENAQIIKRLPQVIITYFDEHTDGEVLTEITKFFAYCMTADGFLRRYFITNANDLCKFAKSIGKSYNYNIQNNDDAIKNFNSNILHNARLLEKLHSLIVNINLIKYSKLAWKNIYADWSNSDEFNPIKITTLQIQCCQHYLTWQLKQIVNDEYSDNTVITEMENLQVNASKYIKTLVSVLSNAEIKEKILSTAFESLSYLYIHFKDILNTVSDEHRPGYRNLSLSRFSDEDCVVICTFVSNKLEKKPSSEIVLDRTREHLAFALKLILYDAIDIIHTFHMLAYFTDKMYSSYGEVFVKFLDCIAANRKVLSQLMWHVLKEVYCNSKKIDTTRKSSSATEKSDLPGIINQFVNFLNKRKISRQEFLSLAISAVYGNQSTSELLPLIEPMLENASSIEIRNLNDEFKKYHFQNKNDSHVNNFRLKLRFYLGKD